MDLNIVIFSKNRALQLDCLLKSIKDNFKAPVSYISVLYKSDDNFYADGYNKLKKLYSINWVSQSNFKDDLFGIVSKHGKNSFTMFLVDDNVVFRPFTYDILNKYTEEVGFISTRVDRSYLGSLPIFMYTEKYLLWDWATGSNPWNYPFSVDGNIHKTSQIMDLLASTNFRAPNTLEEYGTTFLQNRHSSYPLAIAPLEACTINIPLNKVQTEYETAFPTTMEVEYLNTKYLEGFYIDLNPIYKLTPSNCHFPVDIRLKTDTLSE